MDESQEPGLGFDAPQPSRSSRAEPYRVLARKYRPQDFTGLIGQDALVKTLRAAGVLDEKLRWSGGILLPVTCPAR